MVIIFIVVCVYIQAVTAENPKILVWNFAPGAENSIWDPEVGIQVDAAYWLKECLRYKGYTFDTIDGRSLPFKIDAYTIIIASLGSSCDA